MAEDIKCESRGPQHVAIIMDGNGRWASERNLHHIEGHKKGAESVKKVIGACEGLGIEYLTLYAFSTENWKRSEEEVNALMSLLSEFIDNNINDLLENGIRLRAIGRLEQIPETPRSKLYDAIKKTKHLEKGNLTIAVNYGGRAEILDASRKLLMDCMAGETDINDLDEELFRNYLYAPELPDPDLLIRTSGEMRISNFLLWEISYSELYVTDVYWPDFDEKELEKAINEFKRRKRRFGGRK